MLIRFLPLLFGIVLALPGCAFFDGSSHEGSSSSSLEAWRMGSHPSEGPLKTVYFNYDRYDLRAEAKEVLKANAEWLKEHSSAQVKIEGHADERGTQEYNLALGAKRARATMDYLVTLGVSAGRLSTVSYGEELPMCGEHNESCWWQNRNARFAVTGGGPVS